MGADGEEVRMGEAREVMDRVTAAFTAHDLDAVAACYADNVVAVSPDAGELKGRDAVVQWFKPQMDAFPDAGYESTQKYEAGNVAIDEGFFTGTNTGPLRMPSGESVPPTGKRIRVRGCDVATVEGGVITQHHFYFDQSEFLAQLGLLPDMPS